MLDSVSMNFLFLPLLYNLSLLLFLNFNLSFGLLSFLSQSILLLLLRFSLLLFNLGLYHSLYPYHSLAHCLLCPGHSLYHLYLHPHSIHLNNCSILLQHYNILLKQCNISLSHCSTTLPAFSLQSNLCLLQNQSLLILYQLYCLCHHLLPTFILCKLDTSPDLFAWPLHLLIVIIRSPSSMKQPCNLLFGFKPCLMNSMLFNNKELGPWSLSLQPNRPEDVNGFSSLKEPQMGLLLGITPDRLVAKGFLQQHAIDFQETFSPVTK